MIKLIALDLDGTLLNSDHQISPRTLHALQAVMAGGIELMIATGKTPFSALDVKRALGLNSWGVFSQGLTILTPTDDIAHETALPDDVSRKAVALLEKSRDQFEFVIYNRNGIFSLHRSPFDIFLADHHEPHPVAMGKAEKLYAQLPFQKFLIQGERPKLEILKVELEEIFGGLASFVFSLQTVLEIVPAGSSKGGGVAWVLDQLGFEPAELMAFGDGDNDVELLRLAGTGVAMGNGTKNAKRAANYVTSTNDQDGIAEALYHLGLLNA